MISIIKIFQKVEGLFQIDIILFNDIYGQFQSRSFNKRNDFKFPTVNFFIFRSNISSAPSYGGYISQLNFSLRYLNTWLKGGRSLTKTLHKSYFTKRQQLTLSTFSGHHFHLVGKYDLSVFQLSNILTKYLILK